MPYPHIQDPEALIIIRNSHKLRLQMWQVMKGGTSLSLSQCAVTRNGVDKLFEILVQCDAIRKVKLENCQLPSDGLAKIVAAMRGKKGLQEVSLRGTCVDEVSAQILLEVSKTCSKLTLTEPYQLPNE